MEQTKTKDGGPAFPVSTMIAERLESGVNVPDGMSLRDYFAAKAMQAVVSSDAMRKGAAQNVPTEKREELTLADAFAITAYELADAMIKARGEAQ